MSLEQGSFRTSRTAEWRTFEVGESFIKTLDRIETFGVEVWSIAADLVTPSFSYSVGIYDVCQRPELIAIGLAASTSHFALNEAAQRARSGVDLSKGRHSGLIANVDAEFWPVDSKWLHQIMLRTDWYYRGEDVPVLQLIYPDLENRFPGEPDFDVAFEQPFLSPTPDEHESVRNDLWLAHDRASSLSRWKFPTGPHTSAFLSQTVFDGEEQITYVSHDENGDWQFLGDRMAEGGGPVLVCLHHPLDGDRTLEELHDLPANWYATREQPGVPWQRFEHPPEESEHDQSSDPPESSLLN